MKFKDPLNDARLVWQIKLYPKLMLDVYTYICIVSYLIFLIYCLKYVPPHGDEIDYPSVSAMIAYSRGTTLTFSLLVYIHIYAISNYLVIISEYLGISSWEFKVTTVFCTVYNIALIVVSYLPLTGYERMHNIFSITAFVAALLSVIIHRHVFSIFPYHVAETNKEMILIFSEVFFVLSILITGFLFWYYNMIWAEYIFIGLILLDKKLKVEILSKTQIIRIDNTFVRYAYFSPVNPIDMQSGFGSDI